MPIKRVVIEGGWNGTKVKEMMQILKEDGWFIIRTKGSHRQYNHPFKPQTVTLAGHPSAEMHPKTKKTILRDAGLLPAEE